MLGQLFNAEIYLNDWIDVIPPPATPDILPPSIRDVDMGPPIDMSLPMQDPCPGCGAFRMQVGDYVCLGVCGICEDSAYQAMQKELL